MMERLWRSKTNYEPTTKKPPANILPTEISNRIIELEMEIDDGDVNKETVVQLLQEYTVVH